MWTTLNPIEIGFRKFTRGVELSGCVFKNFFQVYALSSRIFNWYLVELLEPLLQD